MNNNIDMNCIICKQITKHKVIWTLNDKKVIIQCRFCKHKSVFPRPIHDEIIAINEGMYKDHTFQVDGKKVKWAKDSIDVYTRYFKKYLLIKNNNKLLDVGGGLGYYSKAFQDSGFDVTTIEMDLVSSEFAEKKLGVNNLFRGTFEEFERQNPNASFNIIFCRHLIEHLDDPEFLIKSCKKMLKPDGLLILETDNNKSIELLMNIGVCEFYLNLYKKKLKDYDFFKLLYNPIFAIDPPRHIHAFNKNNLRKILKYNNLIIKKTFTYSLGSKLWPNIPNTKFKDLFFKGLKPRKEDLYNVFFNPVRILLSKFGLGAGLLVIAQNRYFCNDKKSYKKD